MNDMSQGRALGDEHVSVFRSVLVGRTDQFDGGDELAPALGVVNAHLVLGFVREFGLDANDRNSRGPGGRDHTAVGTGRRWVRRRVVHFISADIDLDRCPEVNPRFGNESGGSCLRIC
jgi:hypothetical protein